MDYDGLLALEKLPAPFQTFTLTFQAGEEIVEQRSFSYGDRLDVGRLPPVPEREGFYGSWALPEEDTLLFDTVIEAQPGRVRPGGGPVRSGGGPVRPSSGGGSLAGQPVRGKLYGAAAVRPGGNPPSGGVDLPGRGELAESRLEPGRLLPAGGAGRSNGPGPGGGTAPESSARLGAGGRGGGRRCASASPAKKTDQEGESRSGQRFIKNPPDGSFLPSGGFFISQRIRRGGAVR